MKTEEIVKYAMAEKEADIILRGGKVANVLTRELIEADVIIAKDRIVHVGCSTEEFEGKKTRVIDVANKIICPGLIESHIHVESSMLSLSEFAKAVIPRGTTTCVIDPHEFANVSGIEGIEIFIKEAKNLPIRFLIEAPSCVPSLPGFETSGAIVDSEAISELMKRKEIFALAEMMNFPGVYLKLKDVIAKIDSAKNVGKIVEGHAPLLTGKELQAYIAAGISSDHEATNAEEALEKLRLGMKLQVREGSFAKDLENIFSKLKKYKIDLRNVLIASDDRNPIDLVEKGHLDYSFRKLVKLGVEPLAALQMFTINTATHLRLENEIGSVAPGKVADLIVVDNLKDFNVSHTMAGGRLIYENNKLTYSIKTIQYHEKVLNTTKNLEVPKVEELKIQVEEEKEVNVRVIGLNEHSLLTDHLKEKLQVEDGFVKPDVKRDILPVVVINRHTSEKRIGRGFVKGLGLKEGAIASTVAHDCHQLICVGTDYNLMIKAIEELKKVGGGQVVVTSEKITLLPLKLAGLMSIEPIEIVVKQVKELHETLKQLKPKLSEPFMGLAFIALPVIPALKLTDYGLVDVNAFKFVNVIVDEKES
ncbi:MAG: adenine deaminase [Candidatus Heimdallarchaeaceae archaeon]